MRSTIKALSIFLMTIVSFHVSANDTDRDLFGIHKSVADGSYSFVRYHLGGPNYDVLINFDSSLGDIWDLAYNINNKRFYAYGKASYNIPSVLLEINAASATVTNLGEISVSIGNNTHPSICTTDGLTFNQTTGELIGTVDTECGSWRAFRVIKFNLQSFGTGSVTSTQIGTLNTPVNLEYDAIAMADNNALQGMDPDIPTNSLKFYSTANVSTSIGATSLHSTLSAWGTYRGLAFNKSENKMYSFQGQNGLRWLVRCNPSYSINPYVFENVSQYDLSGFEIRGIVFGSMEDDNLSIANEESVVLSEIELVVFPNPTTGSVQFLIDSDFELFQILILDASGKVVGQASQDEILARKLDLSFLSEGVYMLNLIFESNKIQVVRVVKQ